MSMGAFFFHMEEFNDTRLLFTHFHVIQYAILSDCLPAAIWRTATKLMEYWREGSTSTAIPPTSSSDVVVQHNKIGGISFGAPLIQGSSLLIPYYATPYSKNSFFGHVPLCSVAPQIERKENLLLP